MLKARNVLRLVLVIVVLAALIVPVLGMATGSPATAGAQPHRSDITGRQSGIELACVPGDPGSSGGGDGGC